MIAARFVVDTSVVMAWCFEDEGDAYAEAVLETLESCEAVVPSIWPLEVGNVLLGAERKRRLSQADVVRFLALLSGLPIIIEQETPERMFKEIGALAREQRLTAYDASYLDLAMMLGLPIATRDASLARAARKCRVPAFNPANVQKAKKI